MSLTDTDRTYAPHRRSRPLFRQDRVDECLVSPIVLPDVDCTQKGKTVTPTKKQKSRRNSRSFISGRLATSDISYPPFSRFFTPFVSRRVDVTFLFFFFFISSSPPRSLFFLFLSALLSLSFSLLSHRAICK